MQRINTPILIVLIIACAGCSETVFTEAPDFVTAVLPSMLPPPATQIATLPISTLSVTTGRTITPIEGTTTTQVNVRAETSTASTTLGLIGQFAKVQVIGRDASGSWYRIIYADSAAGYGWVRAEYVQVNAPKEIPLVEIATGSGSGLSGLVIEKINVRNGPGTTYASLGVLNQNDVVFIIGKDPSGVWMRIEFTNASDGKGWAAAEFLKVDNLDALPVIGNLEQAESPTAIASVPTMEILMAIEDGDSMRAPSAVINFSTSGARIFQFSGDVSSPNGDVEDWVQFTSSGKNIFVEMKCSNNDLRVELWNNSQWINDILLSCEEKRVINTNPAQPYFLRIQANSINNLQYIQYSLKVSVVE